MSSSNMKTANAKTVDGSVYGQLTEAQVERYWEDGFVFPIPVISAADAQAHRVALQTIETQRIPAVLPRPLSDYLRMHSDVVFPLAAKLAVTPAVLDAVEKILGPNLMIWGAEYFIKEAQSETIVSMHQDLTYWGFGETSNQVTAWIAISAATVESGCMDLVRGSHKNPILQHNDTHAANNMLSRGQEVAVDVSEQDRTPVILQPGEMSLHHGLSIHGSRANVSNDRRIGFAIRFINPDAQQKSSKREFARLARGLDTTGRFEHYDAPESLFAEHSVQIYEKIRHARSQLLGQGVAAGQTLFQSTD